MSPDAIAAHLARDPAIATIPAGVDFLSCLVSSISDAYKDDPFYISSLTIYLPNRRAVRAVAGMFGHDQMSSAVIMPRLRALGDIDEQDLLFTGGLPAEALDLLPPADLTTRRLLLAKLIYQREANDSHSVDWPSALRAADELAHFMDGLHRDGVPYEALANFAPQELDSKSAQHWQQSLKFLSVLGESWPALMKAHGWMEPMERRTRLLEAVGEGIVENADGAPVIVAGALGTAKGTARFMEDVARAPNGVVILPGADIALDSEGWAAIDPSHPQVIFHNWLQDYFPDFTYDKIALWNDKNIESTARQHFLRLALRPADATDGWFEGFTALQQEGQIKEACKGLSIIEASTPDEEAALISLKLREALTIPDRTAMLVTADRDLARRVCLKLRAWGIDIDDTGGIPVGGTLRGTLFRSLAHWLSDPCSAVRIMEILNHELVNWGIAVEQARHTVRYVDGKLRGLKYTSWMRLKEDILGNVESRTPSVIGLMDILDTSLQEFERATSLTSQLGVLIALAEKLCATDAVAGQDILWRYEDGELLREILDELVGNEYLPECGKRNAFAALFEALLGHRAMRKRFVGHPRIFVYGLVEARLQSADLTILAGLNETVWPEVPAEDPFLSRKMREILGLTLPDQVIGLSAHDFDQHASRPEVILSRSMRQGRSPSKPSRWWVRIECFLHAASLLNSVNITDQLRNWKAKREEAMQVEPATQPSPLPPVAALPDRLSVTEIGRLLRDPYSVYARRVLKLQPLDPLDGRVGPAERGILIHKLLEMATETEEALLPTVDLLEKFRLPPVYLVEKQRDFQRLRDFWGAYSATVKQQGEFGEAEAKGEWALIKGEHPFVLVGRADRIDLMADGSASIVDFKTGSSVTIRQDGSFDPQLSLLALMLEAGAFPDLASCNSVYRIAYLNALHQAIDIPIYGVQEPKKESKYVLEGDELKRHLSDVSQKFHNLIKNMLSGNRPFQAQVYPKLQAVQGDYDLLSRRKEWGLRGEGDEL